MSAIAVASNATEKESWVEKVETAVLSQLSSFFHDDRTRALDYARSLGFEPLAILPAEIWNQICRQFELYRFRMRNGQTYSKIFYPEWLIPAALLFSFAACLATLILVVPTAVVQNSFLLASAVVVFAGAVLCVVLRYFHYLVFFCLPKSFLLRRFWPNMVSEPNDHVLIPIFFSTDELFHDEEISLRKTGMGYWIASVPEAVQLRRGSTADRMFEACPVLYLEDNDCTIILAQCGDFPREAEAVEFAKMLAQGRFGNQN